MTATMTREWNVSQCLVNPELGDWEEVEMRLKNEFSTESKPSADESDFWLDVLDWMELEYNLDSIATEAGIRVLLEGPDHLWSRPFAKDLLSLGENYDFSFTETKGSLKRLLQTRQEIYRQCA